MQGGPDKQIRTSGDVSTLRRVTGIMLHKTNSLFYTDSTTFLMTQITTTTRQAESLLQRVNNIVVNTKNNNKSDDTKVETFTKSMLLQPVWSRQGKQDRHLPTQTA